MLGMALALMAAGAGAEATALAEEVSLDTRSISVVAAAEDSSADTRTHTVVFSLGGERPREPIGGYARASLFKNRLIGAGTPVLRAGGRNFGVR
ncbi:MAG: hypothetical protein PHG96_03430 [Kiritimatiellae bacterium]|nr:hypothetical protein [Kiritimatiellia bacterium]